MSSKGRGAESVESDFYATPAWATLAILNALSHGAPDWSPRRILEPTAGKGAIVRVLRDRFPGATIDACELDRKRADQLLDAGADRVWVGDFAQYETDGKYDLIITNPPFTCAISIIERCFPHMAPDGLNVQLLRQAILASDERAPFWKRHAAQQNILPRRPSFARSLKCGEPKPKRCAWGRIQEIDAARPDVCLGCGGKVASTTSDSADYAWFVFGDGVEREWRILDIDRSAA
ncbi:MAG TPA: hypothetical protein VGJ91_03355 [Polyangiaceae bacterium]